MSADPSNDARSDEMLVAAINRGDAQAFDALYRRYRDWVVDLAWRFTGDRDMALDVMQETFLYVLKKFPGFKLTASLKTFLHPAVKHTAISLQRRAARLVSDEPLHSAAAPSPPSTDLDDLAVVLAELSPDHRETILLRFVDGLSMEQIARAMNVPTGTVKSRLHHALQTLRRSPRTAAYFNP